MNYPEAITEVRQALDKSGGERLLRVLEEASEYSARHSRRVGDLAMRLGNELPGIPGPVIVSLGFSGMLHDVGKAHPSLRTLVNSSKSLPPKDVETLRRVHTQEGGRRIASLIKGHTGYEDLLGSGAYTALHHHDDPRDLPPKVNASPIRPMITALIHVVDGFEAVQGIGRPYITDPARSPEEAAARISRTTTIQPFFDISPEVVLSTLVEVAA